MQDSGSHFGYGASYSGGDDEGHPQGSPAHRPMPFAGQPGRRRAVDAPPTGDGALLPDTPTRAVRPPKPPVAPRTPEPTDTPPPGYGPTDTPPANRFGWPSLLTGAAGDAGQGNGSAFGGALGTGGALGGSGFGQETWSSHLGLPTDPLPMDEPLIPELPEVPVFPGTESTTDRYADGGYVEDFGPDPLGGGPYQSPFPQPTDRRPETYAQHSFAGTTPRPAPSGAAAPSGTAGSFSSSTMSTSMTTSTSALPVASTGTAPVDQAALRRDQPVLPFVENTGFFQRPAEFRDTASARTATAQSRTGDAGSPDAGSPDAGDGLVVTGSHARIDDGAGARTGSRVGSRTGRRRNGARRPAASGADANGLPGWAAITISLACTGAAILADVALTGSTGVLFGLCFVLTAFGVAAGVRRTAMFTAGVLPPLAALAAFVVLGTATPERFVDDGGGVLGVGSAILSGLASSAWFLVAAWAVALGTLALRTARQSTTPERRS